MSEYNGWLISLKKSFLLQKLKKRKIRESIETQRDRMNFDCIQRVAVVLMTDRESDGGYFWSVQN